MVVCAKSFSTVAVALLLISCCDNCSLALQMLKASLQWNLAAEKILKGRTQNDGLQNDAGDDGVAGVKHDYGYDTGADHSQHQLFIKLEELHAATWVEKAR